MGALENSFKFMISSWIVSQTIGEFSFIWVAKLVLSVHIF